MKNSASPTSRNAHEESAQDDSVDEVIRALAHAPPYAPPAGVQTGTRWGDKGRYVFERRLGRGGMGTVYLATDTLLRRQVAIKVLDAGDNHEEDAQRVRLLREARLAAGLEHERVARIYDAGEHDGSTFVAMEYVRGVTLRTWMAAPRQPSEILALVVQVADGLRVLHSNGVMHRDLKPENVMLQAQGGVKVLDFGLAGHVTFTTDATGGGEARGGSDDRSASAFRGTPGYMAPEQYAGERADARADVFALGVLIYEMVTGERPFRGPSMMDLLRETKERPLSFETPPWRRFPSRLAATVARMLRTNKEDRFADGGEVLSALERIATNGHPRGPEWRRWIATGGVVLVLVPAIAFAAARVAKGIALKRALRLPPPKEMALVDEGTIAIGQSAATVERECADLGAKCPFIVRYQSPTTRVTVPPFFLDLHEVTNREMVEALNAINPELYVERDEDDHAQRYVRFNAGLGAEKGLLLDLEPKYSGIEYGSDRYFHIRSGRDELPAVQVTWFGARVYCAGQGKRLPTENEWEAAARGHDDRAFPWGNDSPRCGQVVVPNDGLLPDNGCPAEVGPVAVFTSSQDVTPNGIHDLGGNAAEWVDAVYSQQGRDRTEPPTPTSPRVIRGGSFFFSMMARTSMRNKRPPDTAAFNVGFRCAADVRY